MALFADKTGSSNPLKNLSSHANQDRSLQHHHPQPHASSSSSFSSAFRTARPPPSSQQHHQQQLPPFDLSSLSQALQQDGPIAAREAQGGAFDERAWAAAFMESQAGGARGAMMGPRERAEMERVFRRVRQDPQQQQGHWQGDFLQFERDHAAALGLNREQVRALDSAFEHASQQQTFDPHHQQARPFQQPVAGFPQHRYQPSLSAYPLPHEQQQYYSNFSSPQHHDNSYPSTASAQPQQQQPEKPLEDLQSSSLSQTASLLLSNLPSSSSASSASPETAAKFANSSFMSLVQGFADKTKDVQGDEVVDTGRSREGEEGWAQSFAEGSQWEHMGVSASTREKGKRREREQGEGLYAQPTGYGQIGGHPPSSSFHHQQHLPHFQHQQRLHQTQHVDPQAQKAQTWDDQFRQVEESLPQQHAKSVHFDPSSQNQTYTDISQETLSSHTSVPTLSSLDLSNAPTSLFAPSSPTQRESVSASSRQPQTGAWEEDLLFGEDETEVFKHYNGGMYHARSAGKGLGERGGGMMQSRLEDQEWGEGAYGEGIGYEAGRGKEKDAGRYEFQGRNPWLDEKWAEGRGGLSNGLETVLQAEAAVLSDPSNAQAWYNLGLSQQQNERESLAILALSKTISLASPPSSASTTHRSSTPEEEEELGLLAAAHLALSISHTNNADRAATLASLSSWVSTIALLPGNGAYGRVLEREKGVGGSSLMGMDARERHEWLVKVLVEFARCQKEELDADVQVALGVLFNTSGEFEKAQDCFRAALSVRPDDWQLYNRLGATLANGGRAEEAHEFYYEALHLRPSFVRARFNLGISCINLKRYDEAIHHILTALRLQQADSIENPDPLREGSASTAKGGSEALWDTLKNACTYIHRPDLVELAEKRDLTAFDGVDDEQIQQMMRMMMGQE